MRLGGVRDTGGIPKSWLEGSKIVGVTAGASAPESLVQEVIESLRTMGAETVEEVSGRLETMEFALPRELRINILSQADN